MKDQTTARQALLQVILAMKDATFLPWTAVRSAWATSLHDLEEGNFGWIDTTQWSINRLSASQISMSGTQASHPSQAKKICKFYNEGICSHNSSHGNYKHVCNFCDRQGKTATHPESKCFQKLKSKDKQASASQGWVEPLAQLSPVVDNRKELHDTKGAGGGGGGEG